MPDLRQQIQQHYDAQALPAGKVSAWVAEGQAVAGEGDRVVPMPVRTSPMWRLGWAIAAALVLFAGLSTLRPWERLPVSYVLFAPRIVDFFSKPPELPMRSQNPEELRSWLLAQGAPADFQIPDKLRGLKSFGCQVVDVHGHPAYLTCFWSEKPDAGLSSLVHLLVAKRSDFRDAPPEGQMQFRQLAGWNFAAWSQGDVIYTMATVEPMDRLHQFVVRAKRTPLLAGDLFSRPGDASLVLELLQFPGDCRLRE